MAQPGVEEAHCHPRHSHQSPGAERTEPGCTLQHPAAGSQSEACLGRVAALQAELWRKPHLEISSLPECSPLSPSCSAPSPAAARRPRHVAVLAELDLALDLYRPLSPPVGYPPCLLTPLSRSSSCPIYLTSMSHLRPLYVFWSPPNHPHGALPPGRLREGAPGALSPQAQPCTALHTALSWRRPVLPHSILGVVVPAGPAAPSRPCSSQQARARAEGSSAVSRELAQRARCSEHFTPGTLDSAASVHNVPELLRKHNCLTL